MRADPWVKRGCSVVQKPTAQALGLVLATLVAYYYAFFDVARWDQLVYLYRTSEIHDLWNLTVRAYDFNRTNSIGDFVLFRPILYMLLGFERWLWGYNFTLWQTTSIGLHILVVLSLFTYCRRRCQRFLAEGETSFAPFVLALFLALLYAGTEMVAWHHVVGYLFFSLLAVQAALVYQELIEKRDAIHAAFLATVVGLACFTYELGNLMAGLMAGALLFTIIVERRGGMPTRNDAGSHGILFAASLVLLCLPVLYVLSSYLNYAATIGTVEHPPTAFTTCRFLLGVVASVCFWLTASFYPGAFQLVPGGRITAAQGFSITGIWPFVGAQLAIVLAVCSIWLILVRRFALDLVHDWLPAASALILALGYAVTIVAGRSMERGIATTLSYNSYYAYIFTLFWLIAYFHFVVEPSVGATERRAIVVRRLLLAALGAIAMTGGSRIYFTHRAMYATYSGPMRELFRRIELVEAQHRSEPDSRFPLRRTVRASSTFHGSLRMPSNGTSATPLQLRSFRTANVVEPASILSNVQDNECGSGASHGCWRRKRNG